LKKIISYIKNFREPVSGLTHLLGALLALFGLILLWYKGFQYSNYWTLTGFIIFGFSMFLLYTSSALYHLLDVSERTLLALKKLDHSMIYVLIAGTYTPLCLGVFEGVWRWAPFITVWGLAFLGIAVKLVWINAPRWLSTSFYLALGWIGIFLFPKLAGILPVGFMIWLGIGGLAYTIGAIIYAMKKPDPLPNVFGFHEIWHIFVMMGTFSHFWAIYDYIPATG